MFICPFENCGLHFTRKDNACRHALRVHRTKIDSAQILKSPVVVIGKTADTTNLEGRACEASTPKGDEKSQKESTAGSETTILENCASAKHLTAPRLPTTGTNLREGVSKNGPARFRIRSTANCAPKFPEHLRGVDGETPVMENHGLMKGKELYQNPAIILNLLYEEQKKNQFLQIALDQATRRSEYLQRIVDNVQWSLTAIDYYQTE